MDGAVDLIADILRAPHRRYRWYRLLRSCDLDPDRLERPLSEPSGDDFIICGCPRSGTSLLAASLFLPPESVVCMEPWDGLRLPPAELFRSLRSEILTTGRLSRGRLDVDALTRGRNVTWMRDGEQTVDLNVDPGFQLGVKWPTFWRYLDLLPSTRFVVCVRDPVEVISSMGRIRGRLAKGLDYDVEFNRAMNSKLLASTTDPLERRALLYEYINSRIVPHLGDSNVLVVRYERWQQDPGQLLSEVGYFLGLSALDMAVSVRPPMPVDDASSIVPLVRSHCPSATELGYEVA